MTAARVWPVTLCAKKKVAVPRAGSERFTPEFLRAGFLSFPRLGSQGFPRLGSQGFPRLGSQGFLGLGSSSFLGLGN
jgi:hypothetical protein